MGWLLRTTWIICVMSSVCMPKYLRCGDVTVPLASLSAAAQEQALAQVPLLLLLDSSAPELTHIAARIQEIGEYTGQWKVTIRYHASPRMRNDIERCGQEGYPFVLYMHMDEEAAAVSGRLYDASDVVMIMGKRWARRPTEREWAACIAHDLWSQLMGTTSSFLSSIAYIQRTIKGKQRTSEVRVVDWDGAHGRTVVQRTTILVSPTWSKTPLGNQRILFSEFTAHNVRVMTTDLYGHVSVALNLPGTTVGVTTAPSGEVIYCRSGELWRYTHDEDMHQGKHMLLISESPGPCASPVLLSTGDIVYCAHGAIKMWHVHTGMSSIIDAQSFCCSPTANDRLGTIVYSRRVKHTMQLFIYDMDTKVHRQITFGPGDKIDPTLSPCGTMIAYSYAHAQAHEIHVCMLATGVTRRISPHGVYCICPAWSDAV